MSKEVTEDVMAVQRATKALVEGQVRVSQS